MSNPVLDNAAPTAAPVAVDSVATSEPAPVDSGRSKADPDIVGLRKELRELHASIASLRTQPAKGETPGQSGKPDGDSLALAELAFRDALDDLDLKVDKGQKQLLRRLYRAEKPSDPGAWLGEAVSSLGLTSRAPATVQAVAPVVAVPASPNVTNTGAPGSGSVSGLPLDPRQMTSAQIAAARASGEYARIKTEWDAKNSNTRNPWAKPPPEK
jgi:hypothetical protein